MDQKDFTRRTAHLLHRAYELNQKGRKQGLWELESCIDAAGLKNRDIFELGIKLAADGLGAEQIKNILSNLVEQERNETAKRFKTLQMTAAICAQEGTASWILFNIIFSLVDDSDKKEVQKHLKDNVFKDYFEMYGSGSSVELLRA
ncbi:MAG: hypothetical protein FWB86_11920 [Treponema sp.]|nr:hypothetical protein [Treponema sp.]